MPQMAVLAIMAVTTSPLLVSCLSCSTSTDPTDGAADMGRSGGVPGTAAAAGGTSGSGATPGTCPGARKEPPPWCDAEQHLVLEPRGGCRFALMDPPLNSYQELSLALAVAILDPSGDSAEMLPLLFQAETACESMLENRHPAWFIDPSTNPMEIGLCPCTCARLAEGGQVIVVYGCGSGGGILSG